MQMWNCGGVSLGLQNSVFIHDLPIKTHDSSAPLQGVMIYMSFLPILLAFFTLVG